MWSVSIQFPMALPNVFGCFYNSTLFSRDIKSLLISFCMCLFFLSDKGELRNSSQWTKVSLHKDCEIGLLLLLSHLVMSDSLQPHGLQHARLACPSLSPWVCSNSRPLSQWCHPTISSSVTPFSSCPRSFPASGPFPMGRLFKSGGQSIGASDSAPVLPMNI